MPRVAVICGFYNRANLVHRTLSGLALQTYEDVEFVLFNDGSTDETGAVLDRLVEQLGDSRFRIIHHQTNIGLTRGLIHAISTTEAPLIAIHDAGDFSMPSRLERQVEQLDRDPDVVVVGSHYLNFIEDKGISRVRRPAAENATRSSLLLDPCFTHGEVMFRRSAYERVGGYRPQFRYSQDNDLWLRMIGEGRFYTFPELLYIRCIQFSGISYNPTSFVRQCGYYVLGKKVANGEIDKSAICLLDTGSDIFDLVPEKDPLIQKVIVRGAARALFFGSPEGALSIASNHIESNALAIPIRLIASVASAGYFRYLYKLLWNIKGLNAKHPQIAHMIEQTERLTVRYQD